MSYCRWSSDDFRCDLYCYEDVHGGYTTHVAGNKVVTPVFPSPALRLLKLRPKWFGWWLWKAQNALHHLSLTYGLRRSLPVPPGGRTSFNDGDLEAFRDRLLWLRSLGYRFPSHVLECVEQELDEQRRPADAAHG